MQLRQELRLLIKRSWKVPRRGLGEDLIFALSTASWRFWDRLPD